MANAKDCHALIPYLLGELTEDEIREFGQHMATCASCQQDCEAMWRTHELLLTEKEPAMDSEALLASLKEKTLEAAFSARPPKRNLHPRRPLAARRRIFAHLRLANPFKSVHQKFLYGIAALIVGMAVGVAGVDVGIFPAVKRPGTLIAQMNMRPDTAYRRSSAMAWIVRQNQHYDLMVYAKDLPQQNPWGCYDVWVVSGAKRFSVAEFTVTGSGIGAVSASIPSDMQFSAIEITLEPHWNDPFPLGPQVLHAQVGAV